MDQPNKQPVQLLVSNKVHVTGLARHLALSIAKAHSLPNPLYYKMMKMGKVKALYGTPKEFTYYTYDKSTNTISVGRGSEDKIRLFLDQHCPEYHVREETSECALTIQLHGDITLRAYQQGDVEAITTHRAGVIKLGVGYGKTIIACALTKKLGVRTLIVAPRANILNQFSSEFRKWYGYDVGQIQGKEETVKDITVATIQTLMRRPELVNKLADKFGMVIYDECHLSITKKQLAVIQSFNPKYLYGMSATPDRGDEQGKAIGFTYGDMVIDKDIDRDNPTVEILSFTGKIPLSENYHEIIEAQVSDPIRNNLIVTSIKKEVASGHKVLVLTKRIEHYKLIMGLAQVKQSYSINSSETGKERFELLTALRSGEKEFNVIYGTMSMLSTGTDIPQLSCVIIAGDLKSSILLHQGSGRVRRLLQGKKTPKIVDIQDVGNKILYYQSKSRINVYKEWGWL